MKYSNRHISDDELDQLFRDAHAAEGQESLFVPEFWTEMEAMLPAEKKRGAFIPWISVAATVLLVFGLIFYPIGKPRISRLDTKQPVLAKDHSENKDNTSEIIQTEPAIENVPSRVESSVRTNRNRGNARIRAGNRPVQTVPNRDLTEEPNPIIEKQEPAKDEPLANNPVSSETNPMDSTVEDTAFEPLGTKEFVAGNSKDIDPIQKNKRNQDENSWYVELGPTIGQSPYLSPDNKRNAVGGMVLGGGYTKKIDRTFVSFGLQARMEGFGGLNYRESNFSQNIVRTVSVKQLYSLELPLRFGLIFNRSEISFSAVPGVQLFIHGKERITENQVVQRQGNYTGKVEHSNSMTMEFGLQYYYHLSVKYSIGAKFNADVLRPFHTDYYLGKSTGLPLNGQFVIRRTF
ncbi:hypothetical protein D3C71_623060 [compost metagenome]